MSDSPKRSRRQFLQGRAAADALTHLGDQLDFPAAPWEDSVAQPYLVKFGRRAMACEFEVSVNAGQYADAAPRCMAALDLIDSLESQLTVYRSDSEIMDINRRAAREAVEVEPKLFELLRRAQRIHAETQGAFDITAGPLIKVWGFYRRQGAVPSSADLAAAMLCVGGDKLRLDPARHTIAFATEGMELNLGSIGKGCALDRCADQLAAEEIADYFMHGGQSSVLARGSRAGAAAHRQGWMVGIPDPLRPGRRLAEVRLRNRALATSGSGAQFFRLQGRRYGHILDPRTGQPASGVLTVTVLAETAAEADALATAFYAMGPEAAEAYGEEHPDVAMFMVCGGESAGPVRQKTFGFEEGELTILPR